MIDYQKLIRSNNNTNYLHLDFYQYVRLQGVIVDLEQKNLRLHLPIKVLYLHQVSVTQLNELIVTVRAVFE